MKDNKGLYITLVVIAVVFAGVIFGGRLLREEIAVGQTVSNDERPAEWNMIIAQEINSRGIQLVLDGKEREVSKGQINSVSYLQLINICQTIIPVLCNSNHTGSFGILKVVNFPTVTSRTAIRTGTTNLRKFYRGGYYQN